LKIKLADYPTMSLFLTTTAPVAAFDPLITAIGWLPYFVSRLNISDSIAYRNIGQNQVPLVLRVSLASAVSEVDNFSLFYYKTIFMNWLLPLRNILAPVSTCEDSSQ
jgi:hypothetical protein